MGINVLEKRTQREYLFYLFYLCSFTNLGGRGTATTVLLSLTFLFCNNHAKYKEKAEYLKVGRWSPCPVLPQLKIALLQDARSANINV